MTKHLFFIQLVCSFGRCLLLFEQALLNRVGYTPEISHGVLVEMAEHKKELEKKTKPILDTLRSYQDLPPVNLIPLDFKLQLQCSDSLGLCSLYIYIYIIFF